MYLKRIKIWILVLFSFLLVGIENYANDKLTKEQIEVSLRMIGHNVLLDMANDSTSLVLPIIEEENRYRIQFATEFVLNPDVLVETISKALILNKVAGHYIVEVEDCSSGTTVYSFEIANAFRSDLIPCRSREYPKGCYIIELSIVENKIPIVLDTSDTLNITNNSETLIESDNLNSSFPFFWWYAILIIFILVIIYAFVKRKNQKSKNTKFLINHNVHMVSLGKYKFNRITGELQIDGQKMQLTSKESDLLQLLHSSLNSTVERNVILNEVWGDEGDYVGRTLDVFISKLRKKLEQDELVRITNVRGVGYKLILG